MYKDKLKRNIDIFCAVILLIILFVPNLIISILVKFMIGSPIIFKQPRPGQKDKNGKETVFVMYKFRTMTNEKDEFGNLLPDEMRLTKFGRFLRESSLDELPELINVLKGDMSLVGPRPQLVRDMVFMSKKDRIRHNVKPGITGLAQVKGRNNISWEHKFIYDRKYVEKISFFYDLKIIIDTIFCVVKKENINTDGMATAEDYGDYLLRTGKINKEYYKYKQEEANRILEKAVESKNVTNGRR